MYFLNSGTGYDLFSDEAQMITYVDKSLLINTVYQYARSIRKYICITRPRRFGKSVAANMIAAFFDESTTEESRRLFEKMEIGKLKEAQESSWQESHDRTLCWPQLGRHKVIRINMIDLILSRFTTYQEFEKYLAENLLEDIQSAYPDLSLEPEIHLSKALEKTGDKYIFVIDEWDAVFEARFMKEEDRESYLQFLKALLKDKRYVSFVYMTGILPIAKYSSGSPLNMFKEFSTFEDAVFYPYFGLTKKEISELMQREGFQKPSVEELSAWYDGYIREDGEHVYNPASVSLALGDGVCKNNWTGTGPMNEVRDIIARNVKDIREDIIRMAGGESLQIELSGFSAEKTQVGTKDEIFSAMVIYGFLNYYNNELRIPNHELMLKFRQALASEQLGLRQTLEESRKLLNATLSRNHREVARLIEELHDEKIPFFYYNDENNLACVVMVGYLAALDTYRITREEKAGKGFVDFLFDPIRKSDPAIILELEYNRSTKNALKCIHERDYIQRFRDHARILLVGINYSERTKKHTCLTELIEQ